MNGRSTSCTTGFWTVEVSGRRRLPFAAHEDHGLDHGLPVTACPIPS